MNYTKLEQNIIDMIKEEQLKLGYRSETVRLYYPLSSLNRFFSTELDSEQMLNRLQDFRSQVCPRLGNIGISIQSERFCLAIPPQGVEYIHKLPGDDRFLKDLIQAVSEHGHSIEEIFQIFRCYSEQVHIEKIADGEFDYLVFFEDGVPDCFRYCLTDEGGHVTYHRFTKEDYQDLFCS
jgi:hypothetical protein